MRIPIKVVLVFICTPYWLNCQNAKEVFELAVGAVCRNDTATYLRTLEDYINKFSPEKKLASAYFLKSIAYQKQGNNFMAINCLEQALANYRGIEDLELKGDTCHWMARNGNDCRILSHYCLLLDISELLQKEKQYNSAIGYLGKLVKEKRYGFSDCANEQRVIESKFSLAKAHCYLSLLDTTAAINALVENCLFDEGRISRELVLLLKPLLYSRYSANEIEHEIIKCIQDVKVKRVDTLIYDEVYTSEQVELTLFGVKISELNMPLKEFQLFISNNNNLKFLLEK